MGGGEMQGKHAPHAFAHARPWDTFKPKVVSKKQVSTLEAFKPGHKANAALGEDVSTSSGAYGAFTAQPRLDPNIIRRRAFGSYALDDDALGPVDLNAEKAARPTQGEPVYVSRIKRLNEEPPPDTLRWNGDSGRGGRGGLAAEARRKAAEAAAEAEAEQAAAAAKKAAPPAPPRAPPMPANGKSKELTAAPGAPIQGARTEKGMQYELKLRARQRIEEEKREAKRAHEEEMVAFRAAGPQFFHPALQDKAKVDAMLDPRVTAALNAKLNAPNSVAAEQFKQRNTTRVSAERKY